MNNDQWTVATLKEYLERLLQEHSDRHQRSDTHMQQLDSAQRHTLDIAIQNVERLLAQATNEAQRRFEHLNKDMDQLKTTINRMTGRGSGLNAGWIYLIAGIGVVGTLVSIIMEITKR